MTEKGKFTLLGISHSLGFYYTIKMFIIPVVYYITVN